jgi:hypothetical protein
MTEDSQTKSPALNSREVSELPEHILSTYSRVWQLEVWLRRMCHVELKAFSGTDWHKSLPTFDRSLLADKELRHMSTPESDPLTYLTFGLFEHYLPPKRIWDAKLDEIAQIRNRIAHFRLTHSDDYGRVVQLLRDCDLGFWTFCTSYNRHTTVHPPTINPVTAHFADLDPFPWVEIEPKKIIRLGRKIDPVVGVQVELLRRPWADKTVPPSEASIGYLYDVRLFAGDGRKFDYARLLEATKGRHGSLVHLCLDHFPTTLRLTIPAVLGTTEVIDIVEFVTERARYNVQRGDPIGLLPQQIADDWSELVLGPENPLTFLDPDMRCSFFGV